MTALGKSLAPPLCVLLGAAALGCTEEAGISEVPNLDAIHHAYDEPTAVLDLYGVRDVLGTFPQLTRFGAAFNSVDPLLDGVEGAGGRARPSSAQRGTLKTTVQCSGAEGQPSADAGTRGSISFELAVEDGRIKPRFWATAQHCVLQGAAAVPELSVSLDGPFAFDVGSPVPVDEVWHRQRTLLVALGTIHFDEYTLGDISARFGGGSVEYLHELDGGYVVLLVTADGVGVRDRDNTWFCGKEAAACTRS